MLHVWAALILPSSPLFFYLGHQSFFFFHVSVVYGSAVRGISKTNRFFLLLFGGERLWSTFATGGGVIFIIKAHLKSTILYYYITCVFLLKILLGKTVSPHSTILH